VTVDNGGMRAWAPTMAAVLGACTYHGRDLGADGVRGDAPSNPASDADVTAIDATAVLGPFDTPTPITLPGSDASDDDPSLTGDELELYFNASRGALSADLWVAKRGAATDPWSTPVPVTELSTASNETTPEVSTDGLTLFFATDRPGGQGGNDIWMSTRPDRTSAWTTPVPVPGLSSATADASPGTTDGLAVAFTSDQDGGGDPDIFVATRPDTASMWSAWQAQRALNTAGHEGSTLLQADHVTLYFDTDRDGDLRLYQSVRADAGASFPAPIPVPGLDTPSVNDQDPWVSPDNRHIVFWSDRGGTGGLWEAWR
jgi:Tol biopolymer transport system component